MKTYVAMILALGMPCIAHADASLFFSPAHSVYEVGKPFEIAVRADASGHLVNAAEGEIRFDVRDVRVAEIRVDGTLVSTWSTYPQASPEGTIRFSGWLNERYTGSDGSLFSVVFVPQRIATGRIEFLSGTLLAADVQETNVLAQLRAAGYTIQAAQVAPPLVEPATPVAQATSSVPEQISVEQELPVSSPEMAPEEAVLMPSTAVSSQTAASALAARFGISPTAELFLVVGVCAAFLFGFVSFRVVRG